MITTFDFRKKYHLELPNLVKANLTVKKILHWGTQRLSSLTINHSFWILFLCGTSKKCINQDNKVCKGNREMTQQIERILQAKTSLQREAEKK